ncbi:DNA-primase RepB domain-containing protein [Parasphingorhabdus sp.]|uniref:DNA-primase RepB domain-containing protein n=1 Tax=Parasphingorhabdus sp. TaxID=2709688 RepID=UPI00300263DA
MKTSKSNSKTLSAGSIRLKNRPRKSGESGENSATPPVSPPLPEPSSDPARPDTNAQFISAISPSLDDGELVAVCSKTGDPTDGGWTAKPADNVNQACPPTANNYFNCSTFRSAEGGRLRAKKEFFTNYHTLVLDDVGTKVPIAALENFPPTYSVLTSPGNYQYGYVLNEPIADENVVAALQESVSAAGLGDPGAFGLARWGRLPFAVNGKPKYQNDGEGLFQCQLDKWSPEKRFSLDALYEGLGLLNVPATPGHVISVPAATRRQPAGLSHAVFQPALDENPVVTALKARGLYKGEISPGVHDVTCPWFTEHTDQIDSGSVHFEPSAAFPLGGFKCHHSHGEGLSISDLSSYVDVDPASARNRPQIRVEAGAIDQVVKACDYVLSGTGRIFQSGGVIVILRQSGDGGDYRMEPASSAELTMALAGACSFTTFVRKEKEWRPCDPTERVVRTLLGASKYSFLPNIVAIARHPFYRPGDGSLVTAPGHDEKSGIYGAFEGDQVVIPGTSREDAEAALAKLKDLFCEFVFETLTDQAAALSAVITATVRTYLPVAPAYLTTAPESGDGKSYLNSVIVGFAGGESAKASFPLDAAEATKSVLALLISSPPCIEYDDMISNFKPHAILNRALTSEAITDRILGMSKTATVSTRVFIIGSGINVEPERDMKRRVITIQLASRSAERISTSFTGNPAALVREKRMEMVSAVLTIIEAWKAAGTPRSKVPPIASYNGEWADCCRHPLIWLGEPDPAQSLFDQVEDDSDGEKLGFLLEAWHKVFGSTPKTVRQVAELADHRNPELREALEDLPIMNGEKINNNKLGWYISKHAKRYVGGLRFVAGRADGRLAWMAEKVVKAEAAETPVSPDDLEPGPRG